MNTDSSSTIPGKGMFFDDLATGMVYHTSTCKVSENSIVGFATEWDPQPFHIDLNAARQSIFRGLSASGLHTLLLTYRLYNELGLFAGTALAGLGIDKIRFILPLRPDDVIGARITVLSKRESAKQDRGIAVIGIETFNAKPDAIFSMELAILLAKKE